MSILIGSITNNLSKYNIGTRSPFDRDSYVVHRGRKKIGTVTIHSSYASGRYSGAKVEAYSHEKMRKANPNRLLPSIKATHSKRLNSKSWRASHVFVEDCLPEVNHSKDMVLLVEQANLIRVPYRGNIDKVLKAIKAGKVPANKGVIEYLCLVKTTTDSTEALKLLVEQGVISEKFLLSCVTAFFADVAQVFPFAQIINRLMEVIDDPDMLQKIYQQAKMNVDNGYKSKKKLDLISAKIIYSRNLPMEMFEEIALTDETDSFLKAEAVFRLSKFDEYKAYPYSWMEKIFQL